MKKKVVTDEDASFLGIVVRAAVAAALVTLLYGTGSLSGMQAAWADGFERVFRPRTSERVAVVGITDADFARADLFDSMSPLDPGTVKRLLERLAAHRPAAVAVDIQLQPPPHEPAVRQTGRRELYATLERLVREGTARWILIEPADPQPRSSDPLTQAAWDSLRGLQTPAALQWASAQLTAEDGLVRRIALCSPDAKATLRPTVLGALIGTADPSLHCSPGSPAASALQRIRFTGGYSPSAQNASSGRVFGAGELLAPSEPPSGDTILTGKMVVLGGTYRDGYDRHWTSAGTMYGVEVWAEAFDTWLRKDALYEPPWPLVFLLQTAIAVGSGWLTFRLSTFWGYATAIAGMAGLTALFSWISFGAGFIVASSLPSFFATQMNAQFGSFPGLVADYAQRWLERRRREARKRQREERERREKD